MTVAELYDPRLFGGSRELRRIAYGNEVVGKELTEDSAH